MLQNYIIPLCLYYNYTIINTFIIKKILFTCTICSINCIIQYQCIQLASRISLKKFEIANRAWEEDYVLYILISKNAASHANISYGRL